MLTKEELAGLRKDGLSDDDILSGYREYNPAHNRDIDALSKEGMKAGAILDGLTEYRAPGPKAEPKAETWGDTAKNFGKAAVYGGASVASGLGKTLEAAGYDNVGPALQTVGRKIAPEGYEPASSKFEWSSPSTYGYIPRALVEGAPGAVVDIGAGLAGGAAGALAGGAGAVPGFAAGFTAAHTARTYGDNLSDRMAYQGKTLADASGADQAITFGATAAEGALGAVGVRGLPLGSAAEAALVRAGLGPALGSVTKGAGAQAVGQLPAQIAGAGARDAVMGAAGNAVQQVGRTIDTDPGLSISPNEIANAGALSGAGGAALRGVRGAGDVYQSTRMRGLMEDTESSTRVADAIMGTRLDVADPKQAAGAIRLVEGQLHRSAKADDIKALLKGSDQETRAAVADSLDRVRRGYELTADQLADLQTRLGESPAGTSLLRTVTDLSTLQKVKGLGEFSRGGFSNPGAAGSTIGRLTNPLNRLAVGGAAAGGAAAYAIPALAQSAALANVMAAAPAVLGGAAAIQGALRGTDALLGTRRPLDQFAQRFAGFDRGDAAPAAGLPVIAPQGPDQARIESQTSRAWARYEAMQAAEAAQRARQTAQEDKAWASREIDPAAKDAQEAAMWRDHDAAQAKADLDDTAASEAIQQGYQILDARAAAALAHRDSQANRARIEAEKQDATEARVRAAREKDHDRAVAQIPGQITERQRTAQMEAMWRDRAAQKAAQDAPRGWDNADAVSGIRQAEAARQAQAEAILAANPSPRALLAMQAQQAAQARAQATAQDSADARLSASRQRDFERAAAQVPGISDRAKAAQIKAMYRDQAARQAAATPLRDWNNADAVAAIRAAEAARQAQSDMVLSTNAAERMAARGQAEPTPFDEFISGKPDLQSKVDPKGKAKAEKKDGKAKSEGDSFTLDGISHAIPDNVQNRAGYIKSIKRKQGQIDGYIRRAQDDGLISGKTDDVISDLREELKTARNKKQARQTVERITRQASPSDREHIIRTFDDDFFAIWSKDE